MVDKGMNMDSKKTTKTLCIVWLVSFMFVGLFSSIYRMLHEFVTGYSPTETFGGYSIFIFAIVLFYFCPLIIFIRRFAKQAKMKAIYIVSNLLILHHMLWLIIMATELIKVIF